VRSPKTLARLAGAFYGLMFGLSIFASIVLNRIIVSGDPATTASNIRQSTALFRIGILSDLLQITCFLLAYMALYVLLKHVNQLAATAMVVFTAVSVGVYSLNLLNLYSALMVATDTNYSQAFGSAGSNALAGMFANVQANGYFVSGMFFGLLLLPFGYLVIKSRYFHTALGVLLVIAGVGYIADVFARTLVPGYGTGITILLIPGAVAEALTILWLLIFGVRLPKATSPVAPQRLQPTA
jgi:hypothetical protein